MGYTSPFVRHIFSVTICNGAGGKEETKWIINKPAK